MKCPEPTELCATWLLLGSRERMSITSLIFCLSLSSSFFFAYKGIRWQQTLHSSLSYFILFTLYQASRIEDQSSYSCSARFWQKRPYPQPRRVIHSSLQPTAAAALQLHHKQLQLKRPQTTDTMGAVVSCVSLNPKDSFHSTRRLDERHSLLSRSRSKIRHPLNSIIALCISFSSPATQFAPFCLLHFPTNNILLDQRSLPIHR